MATHTALVHGATPLPQTIDVRSELSVYVLATTADGTRAALAAAGRYAADLDARIVLVQPHIVPFAADVEDSATPARRQAETLTALAQELRLNVEVVSVLCRSDRAVPAALLPHDALVLVGGRPSHGWWACSAERLAARLSRAGYRALFVPA